MKQNYNYITDRYYPELSTKPNQTSKSAQKIISRSQFKEHHKIYEQKKLQNKLKTIINNIQRGLQEQHKIRKSKNRANSHRSFKELSETHFHNNRRSSSNKDLKFGKIKKAYTQNNQQPESDISSILNKKYEKKQREVQSQYSRKNSNTLILPKINSKRNISRKINEQLNQKQLILGKLVLEKVQQHFDRQKQKGQKYYERVKSEQSIDTSLIQYLKHKVKKANISINKPTE